MTTDTRIRVIIFGKLLEELDEDPTRPGVKPASLFDAYSEDDEGSTAGGSRQPKT